MYAGCKQAVHCEEASKKIHGADAILSIRRIRCPIVPPKKPGKRTPQGGPKLRHEARAVPIPGGKMKEEEMSGSEVWDGLASASTLPERLEEVAG